MGESGFGEDTSLMDSGFVNTLWDSGFGEVIFGASGFGVVTLLATREAF